VKVDSLSLRQAAGATERRGRDARMDAHDEPVADAMLLVGRVGEFAPEPADGALAPDVDDGRESRPCQR
jgi:hypothetical protein